MGLFYDIFSRTKKRCSVCGCHMYDDSDSIICEVCLDDLYKLEPREAELE